VTLWTIRRDTMDHPPGHLGLSTPGTEYYLSLSLLELRFRVALSWGLFLGLVGLL
jgi:hypothetical protein